MPEFARRSCSRSPRATPSFTTWPIGSPIFKPEGIIVSKLDEGTIYGAIFNVCQKAKLPLLYFTTGQRVPEDIEEATQERVAALILDL